MRSEERKQFDETGFVILKSFFNSDLIERLKLEADSLVSDKINALVKQGKLDTLLEEEPFETRLIELQNIDASFVPLLFRAELHKKGFFELFGNAKLLNEISNLMPDADEIRIFPNYSCRPKLPNYIPHNVVWHQVNDNRSYDANLCCKLD